MESIFQQLAELILQVVMAVAAPALTAILIQGLRLISVQLSVAQEQKIRDVVAHAVLEVEEWASARIKAELPVSSGQKLSRAVEKIVDKVPGVSPEEAEVLVREELPKVGLGAVSFLAKTAKAAVTP